MDTHFAYNNTASIVLIEDNATDIMMIKEALKQHDISNPVSVCSDGARAMAFLTEAEQQPGLIILDLNLPKVGGHEVLEAIKADTSMSYIPVVIFTSSRSRQDIARAYELKANCYITKPMDFHRFSMAIKAISDYWLGLVTLPNET